MRLKPRWLEERKIYYTSGPASGSLQKWHRPHSSRLQGFYASDCRSKQVGRTKANVAVRRLQLITLAQGYNLSHYLKVTVYQTSTSVNPGPAGGGSLPSDLSLGFFIKLKSNG
jgi:hypothetical protein